MCDKEFFESQGYAGEVGPACDDPTKWGVERGWSPSPYIICAVLFDLTLFIFICAISVDLDRPRLFAALVI